MRPFLVVIPPYPRAAIDGRLRAAAKARGWRLVVGAIPPRGRVVVVNAHPPVFALATILAVFRLLDTQDAVFAPTEDDGYWLVGLARRRKLKPLRLPPVLDDALALLLPALKVELLATEEAEPLRLSSLS